MKRRQFLSLGAGLPVLGLASHAARAAQVSSGLPFAPPALAPLRRTGNLVELTLTAAPTAITLGNAGATEFWAFNGSIPGPTIDVLEGDRVRILFRNRLPQASTIHWHGLSIPADQDGSPLNPVSAGADRMYEFTLPPGSAGTYWYHPHVHGLTSEQVYRGLAGLFVVRAAYDPLELQDPAEVALVVTDLRLDAAGRIAPDTPMDLMRGRIGDMLLVNGRRSPRLAIRAGETQRWRILNATNARYLRLCLGGRPFTLVGTDGGLLGAPVAGLTELLLAPAERAELLVTSRDPVGTTVSLDSLPYSMGSMVGGGMMGGGMMGGMTRYTAPASANLLALETVPGAAAPFAVPAVLRAIAPLPVATSGGHFVLSGQGMMMAPFAINGRTFDMDRIDATSRRGEVQHWDIVNASAMDHPFHVHGTQFQVLSRSWRGSAVAERYLAWKDTVNVRAGETVSIAFRHEHAGLWMYHCHILEHEDAGMMAVLQVD
jgi:bilirubin oxidase